MKSNELWEQLRCQSLEKLQFRQGTIIPRESVAKLDNWSHVAAVLKQHYHNPDIDAVRVVYSAVAAHDLQGQPVWPMAVAPPGSMKTEVLRALDDLPRVHSVDSVTPRTFISGQIREGGAASAPPSSLLHRIGKSGILVCGDFSTILAIKGDERNAIFADLRRIYDGELRKEFGTSDTVPVWKGRITFVAAVTEAIDKQYSAIQSLGDRFVMVRWARAGEEAALMAMTQDIDRARADLKSAVQTLFHDLPANEPTVSDVVQKQLAALAEFCARARSYVPREGTDKAIVGATQPESATRLSQQLCQLAKGSARLARRSAVNDDDFQIAHRAGLDCIPGRRRQLLQTLIDGGKIAPSSSSTTRYDREDLESLGVLRGTDFSDLAKRLLQRIAMDGTESPPRPIEGSTTDVGGTSCAVDDGGAE
jgi:hypothetical protein